MASPARLLADKIVHLDGNGAREQDPTATNSSLPFTDLNNTSEYIFTHDNLPPEIATHMSSSPFTNLDDDFESVFTYDHGMTRFKLLDLPPEIWLRICELVVVRVRPICVTEYKGGKMCRGPVQPPLTRTCRLLRKEALRMFYHDNLFKIRLWFRPGPLKWLSSIGADNLLAMGSVRCYLKYWGYNSELKMRIAKMRKKLDLRIEVEGPEPNSGGGDREWWSYHVTFKERNRNLPN